ncbi:hypothetical protein [Rhizobium binxianense]
MFAAFETFLSRISSRRHAAMPQPPQVNERSALTSSGQDSESRLRSLREEELFF